MGNVVLRHRVIIQQPAEGRNDYGGIVPGWADFATVWAAVEPLSGREFFAAQQFNAEVNAKIRIRYLSGVTPKMRVLFGTRVFNITAVIDLEERHRELTLMVTEAVE